MCTYSDILNKEVGFLGWFMYFTNLGKFLDLLRETRFINTRFINGKI